MAQRRFHYDAAFEHYLRANAIPYVAVDEARRALASTQGKAGNAAAPQRVKLKNFDFVVYSGTGDNLLVDVKGRKHSGRTGTALQNWVTADDVDSLTQWESIFGAGFRGVFAFLFWCDIQPPDALFHEVFEFNGKWYAVLGVTLADYRAAMRVRSPRWGTVCLPAKVFTQCAQPLKRWL